WAWGEMPRYSFCATRSIAGGGVRASMRRNGGTPANAAILETELFEFTRLKEIAAVQNERPCHSACHFCPLGGAKIRPFRQNEHRFRPFRYVFGAFAVVDSRWQFVVRARHCLGIIGPEPRAQAEQLPHYRIGRR